MIELNMAKFNVKNPQTGEYEPLDGASQAKVQSDWNQTDNSAEDFIKNKPALYTKTQTDALFDEKVNKETGKGLSTNDYTTEEKDKLASIASGAEVNVQSDWSQSDSSANDYIKNKPTISAVNDAALTIQKNGTVVGTFSANAATAATINITVPVDAEDVDALPDTTKYGASFSLSIDSTTYVVTASLKDQDGNALGTAQTIDLPLETVVVGGSYDDTTKKVILTLKNGTTVDFSVADLVVGLQTEITSTNKLDADLVDDTTSAHKFVTAAEKSAWNAKSDFSGDYEDLTNKPTIPAAQVNADWNATSGVAQILNKPTIPAPITVDQTYNAQSANAQSGVAIESKKPGLKTAGIQYTIDGQTVTAGTGAEAFNDLNSNRAAGDYSHAEGAVTRAVGNYSHAEGHDTRAVGNYSHAEGQSTIASGSYSHAEGYATTASENYSHAEGYVTAASGRYSHAEGIYTMASGEFSHAEGNEVTASGSVSHAEGQGTTASSNHQHVQGKYNTEDANGKYAFIIGNGTSDDARHNAFAIDWNGLIYVNGVATGVDVSALYTKSQTDTLLAGKLDSSVIGTGTASTGWNDCRLSGGKIQYYNTNTTYSLATTSSSGLMSASDKQKLDGIDTGATKITVDTDLSSTSTNPVQNKAVQAPLAMLIDKGAKNLLHFDHIHVFSSNGVTFTVNSDGTISTSGTATGAAYCTLTLGGTYETDQVYIERFCDGNHMLAGCPAGGNYRSGYSMYAAAGSYNRADTGNGVLLTSTGTTNIVIVIMIRQGTNANGLVFKPMICTTEDWAVSHTSVPYAMSNSELTKKVTEFGTKLITVKLADRTFTKSYSGLYYSDKVDISGSFSELYAATMQNFTAVQNISIQPLINNTSLGLYLTVCDPSAPSSLSFTDGSVDFLLFGRLK